MKSQGGRKENRTEAIMEKIVNKDITNVMKDINPQSQKAQQFSNLK